jgi:hypothetical protein
MAVGPTQTPIQWVPGALSLRIMRPGREADHSPPSSADVKNAWCLVTHRDIFTFTFIYIYVYRPVQTSSRGQPTYQISTGDSFSRIKRSEREVDHIPRSRTEIKNVFNCTHEMPS